MLKKGANTFDKLMETRSPFTFMSGLTDHKPVTNFSGQDKKALSKAEVAWCYQTNRFVLSDLHIAKIIGTNIFATVPIIKRALSYYHSNTDESSKVAIIKDLEVIKERLDKCLCASQIVYKTVFAKYDVVKDISTRNNASYYTLSSNGYNYVKRLVGFDKSYDEYTGILSPDQAFKYLSVVTVCQAFYGFKGFKSYNINNQSFTVNQQTGRKPFKPYGSVIIKPKDQASQLELIVEPFNLCFNPNRISNDVYIKDVLERFENINQYLTANVSTPLIFTCEDIDSIKQCIELVKKHLPLFVNRIFYTIDKETENNKIQNALLNFNGHETVTVSLDL